MTPQRLNEIEAREKAASEGPWGVGIHHQWHPVVTINKDPSIRQVARMERPTFCEHCGSDRPCDACMAQVRANGVFIAEARTDIPDLVGYVRALTAERDAAIAKCKAQGVTILANKLETP